MRQIIPSPAPPRRGSHSGWLAAFGVILLFIGIAVPATRIAAVAILVAGLVAYVFYLFWKSRKDPRALEKEIEPSDDNVIH
jgi:hypothetical protein